MLSVIVTSVVAAGYVFVPSFQQGVGTLAVDVSQALATGDVGGVGFDRSRGFAAASGSAVAAQPAGDAASPLGESAVPAGDTALLHPGAQNSTDSGGSNNSGLSHLGTDTIQRHSNDPLIRNKSDEMNATPAGKSTTVYDVAGAQDG